MATIITEECINCGACEPECPNTAIYQGGAEYEWQGKKYPALSGEFFYIVPEKCTECVGFFDHEACAAVCPVDCCIPDPNRPETEEVLLQRAREIHGDREFAADAPSRFRKKEDGATAAEPVPVSTPVTAAVEPESAPVKPEEAPQPAEPEKDAAEPASAPKTAAVAAAAGKPTGEPLTAAERVAPPHAAAKAAAKVVETAKPAPTVAVTAASPAARTDVTAGSTAASSAAPSVAPAVADGVEKPVEQPRKALSGGDPSHAFAGELGISFDEALRTIRRPQRRGGLRVAGFGLLASSPLLGALDDETKRRIEQACDDTRVFSARVATVLNVALDFLLYPAVFAFLGSVEGMRALTGLNKNWIVLGVLVATVETLLRLRDTIVRARPKDEIRYGASFYGIPLGLALRPLLSRFVRSRRSGWVPVEGFYSRAFESKREREKRYGEVYALDEFEAGYCVRMELPRWIPPSVAKAELGFGDEMPDYDLRVAVGDGTLTVRGAVVDPDLRAVCGVSPAFPADFRTEIALAAPLAGFRHRYTDKLLEIVVLKRGA